MMKLTSYLILFLFSAASCHAAILSRGHADIGIGYSLEGGWDPHIHAESGATVGGVQIEGDYEYEPDEITFLVPDSRRTNGLGTAYDLTGANGGNIWIMPAGHAHGAPHLGFATEEIDAGIFQGNEISITVNLISGPGHFSIWTTDSFNEPDFLYTSFLDGIDTFTMAVGIHEHFNLGFTAAGDYEIEFTFGGFLEGTGDFTSDSAIYSFQVVPEPSTYAMIFGVSVLALAMIRRRRK